MFKRDWKRNFLNRLMKCFCLLFLLFACSTTYLTTVHATTITEAETDGTDDGSSVDLFGVNISSDNGSDGLSGSLQMLLVLTIIALAPSILIMLTSFTRILIVLHFTRSALNTQTAPPNQVLIGMALFLTLFIMGPIFSDINENAVKPLSAGEITQEEAYNIGMKPLRKFMLDQTNDKDLNAMLEIAGINEVKSKDDIPISVVIPSFILSELRIAFWIGFLIYIPFIIIDMVVASTLMSMGMMMLPPTTISMPFKILLFVLADGWNLIIVNLMKTFVV